MSENLPQKSHFLVYQAGDGTLKIDVRLENGAELLVLPHPRIEGIHKGRHFRFGAKRSITDLVDELDRSRSIRIRHIVQATRRVQHQCSVRSR